MQPYFIGADIGTGSAKAVAITAARKVIATSQAFYSVNNPKPGHYEQDPEIIYTSFIKCINEIIFKLKRVPDIVSISSAMHSIMVIDKKNNSLTPLITWEDTRSNSIADALRKSGKAKKLYTATGTPVHSMSPLCKIKWLKENETRIFKNAYKFISIKEFIWYKLFNEYEIDHSIASATGLFDIKNLKWYQPSLQFCGIDESKLSKPVTVSFTRNNLSPQASSDLKVSSSTQFCIGASDGCLANLGSYAIKKGIAALTIGTSGAVRIASPKPITDYSSMIFNYILDDKIFISGGPVNNGGNVLKWMFNTFLNNINPGNDDYNKIFRKTSSIRSGCDGLIFLPYLYGERAPIWDEKANGAFIGMQSFHTTMHFFRAAMEGICFSLKNILEILEASSGKVQQLNVSGGFVHSNVWMQILADITGKKVCRIQSQDASSIGAALLGMKAVHFIKDFISLKETIDIIVMPIKKNVIAYKKYYAVFKSSYPLLKRQMHLLKEISQ